MATPTPRRFANYPAPIEAKNITYDWPQDKNPALRGLPLAIGASIVSRVGFLQKTLFNNAGFGSVKDIEELQGHNWRFHPTVIPLPSESSTNTNTTTTTTTNSTPSSSYLPIGPELQTRTSSDQPGRYYTSADYHALYTSGSLSPVDVVTFLSAYTVRAPPTTNDNPNRDYQTCWTYSNVECALARAKESEARYRTGKPLSVLDGVPIGVKDDLDVTGYRTCNGMPPKDGVKFFEPAQQTIWPVLKLEEAGAIVVGKLAMHELGSDTSGCNPHWGTPSNFHNSAYYPGGSSSGPGAAVAAGLIPISVATDAGGSIRIPPSFQGVYGLKVSHDRTDTMNSTVCVTGPLCSTATDLAIAYRIMSQPNPNNPVQGSFALSQPPPPAPAPAAGMGEKGDKKYLGICKPWFDHATPKVHAACLEALDFYCNSLGYDVVEIDLPHLRAGQLAHGGLTLAEMADHSRHRASQTCTSSPPDAASTAQENHLNLVNSPNKLLLTVASQMTSQDYLAANQLRSLLMSHLAHLYEKYPGMLIVTPTTPLVGWKKERGDERYGFSDGNITIRNVMYVWLANMSGCPAVSCPVGYADVEEVDAEDGTGGKLPIGMMAMGEWGEEERVLEWAREAEEYLRDGYEGGRRRPGRWVDVLGLAGKRVDEEVFVEEKRGSHTSGSEGGSD